MDQDKLNEIILPTLNVSRNVPGYGVDENEVANQSAVYITTAGYKGTFSYDKLIQILCQSVARPDQAIILGGTYRTPMMERLLSRNFISDLKQDGTFNEASFDREYNSIWSGSIEGAFFDTCQVLFVGNPTTLSVDCDNLTEKTGSFGKYYEIGASNTYTFDITPGNVFGMVGAECNYTFEVKGHGSFKTQTQYYYTVNDGKTWEEGTEQTVNIADVTTVSKYEPSVFDWSVSGDKLTVTVNCTLESYYTSSVRNGNMITYENRFREYTDDNWYYEVIVTETNSGVSTSFKVRPVKTVTNVVLADDIVTF